MKRIFAAVTGLVVLAHSPVRADDAGVTGVTGGAATVDFAGYTAGWDFTVDSDVTVTKLGFFAAGLGVVQSSGGGGGTGVSSQIGDQNPSVVVGLWTGDGTTLLGQATVTASGLDNGVYYTALPTGIALVSGNHYLIGALLGTGDTILAGATSVSTSSHVTYNHNAFGYDSSGLSAPTATDTTDANQGNGFFGPNFQYVPTPVPEPSTYAAGGLLLLAFGGSVFRTLRKKVTA